MSSFSTTTVKDDWVLTKYSRSTQSTRPNAPNGGEDEGGKITWEHYTQPRLSLHLETTSTALSAPQQLLTIAFEPSSSTPGSIQGSSPLSSSSHRHSNQASGSRIVLESINFSSFSSAEILALTPPHQLPLKAIFKNNLLGLKYISVSPSTAGAGKGLAKREGQFRRFQARFTTVEETLRFVKSIEAVCPTSAVVDEQEKTPGSQASVKAGFHPPTPQAVFESNQFSSPSTNSVTLRSSSSFLPLPIMNSTQSRHSTLFPNLTASLRSNPVEQQPGTAIPTVTSKLLMELGEEEFEKLLGDVLEEEGFENLVQRVQTVFVKLNGAG